MKKSILLVTFLFSIGLMANEINYSFLGKSGALKEYFTNDVEMAKQGLIKIIKSKMNCNSVNVTAVINNYAGLFKKGTFTLTAKALCENKIADFKFQAFLPVDFGESSDVYVTYVDDRSDRVYWAISGSWDGADSFEYIDTPPEIWKNL
jgi:hypothetical protein